MANKEKLKIYKDMMSDQKVRDEINSLPEPESLDQMAEVLGGVGTRHGFALSKDDFLDLFSDLKARSDKAGAVASLADSDLAAVSGGVGEADCKSNPIITGSNPLAGGNTSAVIWYMVKANASCHCHNFLSSPEEDSQLA